MIMNPQPTDFSPMLTALSDGDKRTIYHAALQVLAHTGMTLQHDDAVKRLKDAGSQQDARAESPFPPPWWKKRSPVLRPTSPCSTARATR
jgi:hypothetical protein